MYPPQPGARPLSLRTILILALIAFVILAIIEEAEGSERTRASRPAAAGAAGADAEGARIRRYCANQQQGILSSNSRSTAARSCS